MLVFLPGPDVGSLVAENAAGRALVDAGAAGARSAFGTSEIECRRPVDAFRLPSRSATTSPDHAALQAPPSEEIRAAMRHIPSFGVAGVAACGMTAVDPIEAPGLDRQSIKQERLGAVGGRDGNEGRPRSAQIELCVQLHRRNGACPVGPRAERQPQIGQRSVQRVDGGGHLQRVGCLLVEPPGSRLEPLREVGEQAPIASLVGIAHRPAPGETSADQSDRARRRSPAAKNTPPFTHSTPSQAQVRCSGSSLSKF
jgi:hypothetical protein